VEQVEVVVWAVGRYRIRVVVQHRGEGWVAAAWCRRAWTLKVNGFEEEPAWMQIETESLLMRHKFG
jgi:hypothetical protein